MVKAIRAQMRAGEIKAISVDTCIVERGGFRLESGILKRLEQFQKSDLQLVLSEITVKELIRRITKETDEARNKLKTGLNEARKYFQLDDKKYAEIISEVTNDDGSHEIAEARVRSFIDRCGGEIVNVKNNVDIEILVQKYFGDKLPFEKSKDKKSEFPDAMMLMSLEAWANNKGGVVLLVTADKGCQKFCHTSTSLVAVENLGLALELVQERNEWLEKLTANFAHRIAGGHEAALLITIQDAVSSNIDVIDWSVEASAYCNFDYEIHDLWVEDVQFLISAGQPLLHAIEVGEDALIIQATMRVLVHASCHFQFSVRDSIDRDMVPVGDAMLDEKDWVQLDVLLTASSNGEVITDIREVELVSTRREIDFGEVSPDYSNEDPTYEKY